MFANRFTAVVDACVLAAAAPRDLLLSLAQAELYRLRWSSEIMSETEAAIAKILQRKGHEPPDSLLRAERACAQMRRAFPESAASYDVDLLAGLPKLPDEKDMHVLAAAVACGASIIVTENVKDFPAATLETLNIEIKPADDFIADTIDLDYDKSLNAIKMLRQRLKNPALTQSEILERWRGFGLQQTAEILNPHTDSI